MRGLLSAALLATSTGLGLAADSRTIYQQLLQAPAAHRPASFAQAHVDPAWTVPYDDGAGGKPPSPPPPPALYFSGVFSNFTVLQRAPAKAAVFGMIGPSLGPEASVTTATTVSLTVEDSHGGSTHIKATVNAEEGPMKGHWKAFLPPTAAGTGSFRITASCTDCGNANASTIHDIVFGDVFVCSGQSNMQLSMAHTFDLNMTLRRIHQEGKYHNIRMMQVPNGPMPDGQEQWILKPRPAAVLPECDMSCESTWLPADAMMNVTSGRGNKSHWTMEPVIQSFSGACFYFAAELTDILYSDTEPVPIGLIETAVGGTQIEGWLSNATLKASCTNQTGGKPDRSWAGGNGALYNGMILPLVNFTIKGAMWYQGENNCAEADRGCTAGPGHGGEPGELCGPNAAGSVLKKTGYPCYLKAMVDEWRDMWSVEAGTTDPAFPFGVFTLASTEGRCGMGSFRQAQTAGFGILPSPDLPNTFVAQGFDAQDPVGIANWPTGERGCRAFGYDSPYSMGGGDNNQAVDWTPFFMGPIHPRPKHILGRRMAMAAAAQVYGDLKIGWTGPVIKNCSVSPAGVSIAFNEEYLRDDAVMVFPAVGGMPGGLSHDIHPTTKLSLCKDLPGNATNPLCSSFGGITPMEIEYTTSWPNGTNVSVWLPVSLQKKNGPFINTDCKPNPKNPKAPVCTNYTKKVGWQTVETHDYKPPRGAAAINFAKVITGIRYAWGATPCCPTIDRGNLPCPPNSCPIRSWNSTLPAAPFYAKIVDGKCKCTAPQVCD